MFVFSPRDNVSRRQYREELCGIFFVASKNDKRILWNVVGSL